MYTLLVVLACLVSVLMCGIVMIQESKGGGLASSFSSSNQIMGVKKTTDFLEKGTWVLAAAIVVLSVVSAGFVSKTSEVDEIIEIPAVTLPTAPETLATPAVSATPATPAETPAQ